MSLRIGGYAAIVGGALWLFGLAYAAASAAAGSDAGRPLAALILVIGNAALLVALAGLSAFQARRYPRLTWAAFIVPTAGAVVAIFGLLAGAYVGDPPLIAGVSAWYVWLFGTLALVVGSAIFGAVTWRTGDLPRPGLALLAAGALVIVPFIADVSNGVVTDPVLGIALVVCMFLFAAGWAVVGWSALRLDRSVTATATA